MPRNPPQPGSITRRRMLQAAAVAVGADVPGLASAESAEAAADWPGSGALVLSGRLTDARDQPLAGRRVGYVTPAGVAGACLTDGDGRFVLAARAGRRGALSVDQRAVRAQPLGARDTDGVWRGSVAVRLA